MKFLTLFILFCILTLSSGMCQETNHYADKASSLDSILYNLYGAISGEKGEARDWELMKYLFHPDARLIPSGKNQEGNIGATFMTVQDYIDRAGPWLIENGFFEKEIHREVDTFGNITQVFSTYESFRSESDEAPFMRGINSIQLLNDGTRWWIINIYWMQESKESPIPGRYLPKP